MTIESTAPIFFAITSISPLSRFIWDPSKVVRNERDRCQYLFWYRIDWRLELVTTVQITKNYLFDKVKELESRIHILQERAKNMGIIFNRIAFLSETEFLLWYFAENPTGKGLAAVVHILSIWQFSMLDQDNNVNQWKWLAKKRHMKNIGLKHKLAAKYVHSMSVQYPAPFAGSEKCTILSLSTNIIAMLKSLNAWQGSGMGDKNKERLSAQMHAAVERHTRYCKENLPDGSPYHRWPNQRTISSSPTPTV